MMGASRLEQTDALFRKNLVIQRRACKTNCCLILFPLLLCSVIGGLQIFVNHASSHDAPPTHFDCSCSNVSVDENALGGMDCASDCPLPRAPKWPPRLRLPPPEYRAVQDRLFPSFTDLPDASCRATRSCPATFLVTGGNRSFVGSVAGSMFIAHSSSVNLSADIAPLSDFVLADDFTFLQNKCFPDQALYYPIQIGNEIVSQEARCAEGLMLWRDSSWVINDEIYRGYYQGNNENKTDEIAAAYDFLSSDQANFNLIISYNSSNDYDEYLESEYPVPLYDQAGAVQKPHSVQVARLSNMASNAYLNLRGNDLKMSFDFVKEMPRAARHLGQLDISPLIGKLPFVWTMELLFPVILSNIVYEKQKKLRIMMKMHGLGDLPYWAISYCYFLLLSLLYVLSFMLFGSVLGMGKCF